MSRFFNFSHISAGFIAMLVGYTSSAAIVIQAATASGATSPEQLGSWLWALGVGMGITCIGLSWYFRVPIVTAWSTGGAALLVTALSEVNINEAVGAFIFSSALITLCGVTGCFSWIIKHVPKHLAAAMLSGILLHFGLELFVALKTQMSLVFCMLIVYFITKQLLPKYKILIAFIAGLAFCLFNGMVSVGNFSISLASPQFIKPSFSLDTIVGVGIPLFVVTMASQNIPGIALLRAQGYNTSASPIISWTGITGVLLAPFGGYAFNIAVLTAAICMNSDVAEHKDKRYPAAMWAGVFYFILGLFGSTVASTFAALPKEFIAAIAGVALLGIISLSMTDALEDGNDREISIITFLITASGITIFGIGSAFWGLLIGVVLVRVATYRLIIIKPNLPSPGREAAG
jgi:benzoate membrane transport protein